MIASGKTIAVHIRTDCSDSGAAKADLDSPGKQAREWRRALGGELTARGQPAGRPLAAPRVRRDAHAAGQHLRARVVHDLDRVHRDRLASLKPRVRLTPLRRRSLVWYNTRRCQEHFAQGIGCAEVELVSLQRGDARINSLGANLFDGNRLDRIESVPLASHS